MKIGVKTFDNEKFLKHFEDKVDFFEIMAVQKNDYSFLKNFSLPMVIHAEHQGFGVNLADSSKKEFNLNAINFARKVADSVNAKKIIVHPGEIEKENKNSSMKNAIDFLNELNDERILVENLYKEKPSEIRLCKTPREIKKFMKKTNAKFCFDVNHAIGAIKNFNGKYNFVKKYIQLNPAHYHIGGQRPGDGAEHTCLADSELDLKKILSYYPDDAEITLETEVDIAKVEKDIEIIRNALKEL
ncbi:endonuclease 4 [uncultured archaeon]|nr:endonuclease 4 [uncultured archaeon]